MKKIIIILILGFSSITYSARHVDDECIVTGCSGEICMNQPEEGDDGIATSCEYKKYYECYKITNCVIEKSSKSCGWEKSQKFLACLKEKEAPQRILEKYAGRSALSFIIMIR